MPQHGRGGRRGQAPCERRGAMSERLGAVEVSGGGLSALQPPARLLHLRDYSARNTLMALRRPGLDVVLRSTSPLLAIS